MSRLILDVETTISESGNPFDQTNKLCYVGIKQFSEKPILLSIEYDSNPYKDKLDTIQHLIDSNHLLIGFNIKFDLHWIRRYGINFSNLRVWDCQLVHFIITGQSHVFPSLNEVAEYYGLPTKLDVISKVYWENGMDTTEIPKELLEEYLEGDLSITEQVYIKQMEYLVEKPLLSRLVSLHNQDLKVLEEMEFNGLIYDTDKSLELAKQTRTEIERLDSNIYPYHNFADFNANSPDQLSALLYGGKITYKKQEPIGVFKTGTRKGETKYGWKEYEIEFPRLVTPIKGTELAKEGLWSTAEPVLRNLRASKKAQHLIELLLKKAELEKLVSTYYEGIPNLQSKLNLKKGMVHGQLNQTVARTGRLSSSKPNLQNFDGGLKVLFPSRFNG